VWYELGLEIIAGRSQSLTLVLIILLWNIIPCTLVDNKQMETARFSEIFVSAYRPNYTLSYPIIFIFAMPELTYRTEVVHFCYTPLYNINCVN